MTDKSLTTIGPLQQALALATQAGDIGALRDVAAMAKALKTGAQARGMGIESENAAAEVILRAERAMGVLLIRMAADGARMPRGGPGHPDYARSKAQVAAADNKAPELADLGVTRDQSSKWQSLARVSDDTFEGWLTATRERNERLAKVNAYALARPSKATSEARSEVMAAWHEDDATAPFVAFGTAVERIIPAMPELPTDELGEVAGLIRRLADAYNAAKVART